MPDDDGRGRAHSAELRRNRIAPSKPGTLAVERVVERRRGRDVRPEHFAPPARLFDDQRGRPVARRAVRRHLGPSLAPGSEPAEAATGPPDREDPSLRSYVKLR